MNRREFFRDGAAVMALSALPQVRADSVVKACAANAVYDGNYPEGRAFAEVLSLFDIETHDACEDAAALWYSALRPELRHAGEQRLLAGLTTAADFSIMESLARDMSLTLRHHCVHHSRSGSRVEHSMIRSGGDGVELADLLARAGSHWPGALAKALVVRDIAGSRPMPRWLLRPRAVTQRSGVLISWVLA